MSIIKWDKPVKLLLIYSIILFSCRGNAQNDTLSVCFTNPSFEGSPMEGQLPAPWQQCNKTLPGGDTQPGFYNITLPASQGNTYVSLYSDAETGFSFMESAGQQLCSPLIAGKTYFMKMDIAISETALFTGSKKGALQIWGGNNLCDQTELLWQDSILNHNWKTYDIFFTPKAGYRFLVIKPAPIPGAALGTGAFFLIDNIVVEKFSVKLSAQSNQLCSGACTKIEAVPSKGVAPYTYVWSDTTLHGSGPHFVCPTATTAYSVTVIDNMNSIVSETITIAVIPPPSVSVASSKAKACAGESVTLSATGDATSFKWSNNAITSSITVTPSSTSTYTVIGTAANGCSDTATAKVIINPLPLADAGADAVICSGQSATLTAKGGIAFNWSPQNGISSNSGQTISASPTVTTNYTVTVTDTAGCKNTDDVKVVVLDKRTITVSPNITICQGESAQLTANGGINYVWSPAYGLNNTGISNPVASPGSTTTYTVVASSGNCPTDSGLVQVKVNPLPTINFTSDQTAGCAPLTTIFKDSSPDSIMSYLWKFGDGGTSSLSIPTHEYKQPGQYSVTLVAKSRTGCSQTKTIANMISVYPKPAAGFSYNPKVIYNLDEQVSFFDQSKDATSWEWDFGDKTGTAGSTEQNPKHYFKNAGTYCVKLKTTSKGGCMDSAITCLQVREFTFYIPNAFTPNDDGDNDNFTGYGTGMKNFEMWIYDRWGNLVYYSSDPGNPWNGSPNNGAKTGLAGVYAYVFRVVDLNNRSHTYIGHCTLVQ
jgi:gliding motility-associated-like protein